jgi:hypothetical protein
MRFAFIAACLVCANAFATTPAHADDPPADKPESSTGRTQTPETKGQKQPQGWTGPTTRRPPLRRRRTNSAQNSRLGGERSAGSIHAAATAIVGTVWIVRQRATAIGVSR